MFCRNCQTIIPDDSLFCENCGAPTGLDPEKAEKISADNLVPEESVDYEVEEEVGPLQSSSVPVDPVWWEPPEDEFIDVEAQEVSEDETPADEFQEDEAPEDGEHADGASADEALAEEQLTEEAETAPAEADEDEFEEKHSIVDREHLAETASALKENAEEIAADVMAGARSLAKRMKAASQKLREAREAREQKEHPAEDLAEEAKETPDAGAAKSGSRIEYQEITPFGEDEAAKAEAPAETAPEEVPEEVLEEAPEDAPEEAAPAEAKPLEEDVTAGDEKAGEEAPAEEELHAGEAFEEGSEEEPAGKDAEDAEKSSGRLNAEELTEDLKRIAAAAAEQAKPYAKKAKIMLGDLGKTVRTGTGWAADAAKEQFQQQKEAYEERKEQRDQQREVDRQKKAEEQKHKEWERQRKERERQKELERQKQREQEIEENVIQQPGFWYGDEMPEPTIAFAHAVKAGEKPEEQPAEAAEPVAEAAAEIGAAAETIAEATAETGTAAEPDVPKPVEPKGFEEAWADAVATVAENAEAEAADKGAPEEIPEVREVETPDVAEIEDKLADTARFDWNIAKEMADEVAAAAAAAAAADRLKEEGITGPEGPLSEEGQSSAADDRQTADGEQPPAEEGQSVSEVEAAAESGSAPVVEDGPDHVDEPSIYRIQDFGGIPKKKVMTKNRWIILAIVIGIVVAAIGITALILHQAHLRQLEEEAYQASMVKAHDLVDEGKYKKAEKAYLALIDERPEDPEPYLGLAQMYIDQQRYVDAKALVKRAEEATEDEEAFKAVKKKLKILTSRKWKKEYIKVLEENEDAIKQYEETVMASVAVCDVNGDMTPELFFFTREYYGYGKLHIYTTVKGKSKEVKYECQNRGTQYSDAFYDVSSEDSSYAIFNTKKKGRFAIYANIDQENDSWDTMNEYKLGKKGKCRHVGVTEGAIHTTYNPEDEEELDSSEYLQDGEGITYDKYATKFKGILDNTQQVILYNGSGGDQAVWDKVKPENVMCMSYDALMHDLKAK